MTNKKIKRAVVLAENKYEDLEFRVPLLRLREAGITVQVAAPKKGELYTGKHGYPVKSDAAVEEIDPNDIDLVVIPGGYAPDHMRRNRKMVGLVRNVYENGGLIAFICHAGWLACSAGILKEKKPHPFFPFAMIWKMPEHTGWMNPSSETEH